MGSFVGKYSDESVGSIVNNCCVGNAMYLRYVAYLSIKWTIAHAPSHVKIETSVLRQNSFYKGKLVISNYLKHLFLFFIFMTFRGNNFSLDTAGYQLCTDKKP